MKYTKKNILSRMQQIHDDIKHHPFRMMFEEQHIPGYKHLWYELSEAWVDLAYRCPDFDEAERQKYRQFCKWVHDYRQNLRTWRKDTFPMEWNPYYEQMLQITHRYLDTGEMDEYYDFYWFTSKNNQRVTKVSRCEYITSEKCGIKSPALPRYMPVDYQFCVDDELMKDFYLRVMYRRDKDNEAQRLADFEAWHAEMKPILEWINSTVADKELVHDQWVGQR